MYNHRLIFSLKNDMIFNIIYNTIPVITAKKFINKWSRADGVRELDLSQHGLMDNEVHDNSSSLIL